MNPDPAGEILLARAEDGILELTLNRPEVRNALSFALLRRLADRLREARDDPQVRCVILTGAGGVFAAGADVRELAETPLGQFLSTGVFDPWQEVAEFPKPLVAAVAGYALGGGLELVLACDLIVAAQGTRLGQPEIRLGLIPGAGGTQRLARQVGKYLASEIVLAGRQLTAEEALGFGLVNRVVPPGEERAEAWRLARQVAAQAPLAVVQGKAALRAALEGSLSSGLAEERQRFFTLLASEDGREGTRAFLEKRTPTWRGR